MFWIKTCQRFGTVNMKATTRIICGSILPLGESKTVNGLRILPRNGAVNGVIVEYRIEVSNDNGQSYHEVATGTWTNDSGWKWAQFDQTEATNVRLYAVRTLSDQAGKELCICGRNPYNEPKKKNRSRNR